MNINSKLWRHYRDVYFFINSELNLSQFAIITAWNPYSIKLSKEQNEKKNNALEQKFNDFNYCKLLVGDLKRTWLEESFAVEIPQNLAIELGKMVNQNAIYYVKNNQLYLISCLENNGSEMIGTLSQKIVIQKN